MSDDTNTANTNTADANTANTANTTVAAADTGGTPDADTSTVAAVPASEKPFSVSVEGAEGDDTSAATVTGITMQPEDPADAERAAEVRERVEARGPTAQTQAEMARGAEQIGSGEQKPGALSRIEAEMQAGRERLAVHAGRRAMLDAKRDDVAPEGKRVADATESNRDL